MMDIAIWIIAVSLGIIALPTLLAILLYAGAGALLGILTLRGILADKIERTRSKITIWRVER